MNRIEVYSADNCPWCNHAKSLLCTRGLDFVELDISSDPACAREMTVRSGRRMIPQVFIDDVPVGGFNEHSMFTCQTSRTRTLSPLPIEESSHDRYQTTVTTLYC